MKTILMKFAGPLQSWGTKPHFETYETDRYPSKSGVIGMVAAALGYRRDEDEKLRALTKLDFAVRVDQTGGLLRDFQIAKNTEKNLNYVTNRYYLQDAVFVVALSSSDDRLMEKISSALRAPYFPLYLGRRSAPINVDYWLGMNDKSIMDDLKAIPWQASWSYQRRNPRDRDVWADSDLIERSTKLTRDLPESFADYSTTSPYNHSDRRSHHFRSVGHIMMKVKSAVK